LQDHISASGTARTFWEKWMNPYSSLCDDFYVNLNLSTEMELPQTRETVLHYLERIQKQYPTMRNFYAREKGEFVLEEDKEGGQFRWTSVENRRLASGFLNPESVEKALEQHRLVLEMAPVYLSMSPLDCETLDLLYVFDFNYRGNQNKLVAEALGASPAVERLFDLPGGKLLNFEPSIKFALDEDCRTQCSLSVETRNTLYQIRSGDFPEDQISVYFTARQLGSLEPGTTFAETLEKLAKICREMVESHVIDNVLRPLAAAIAIK
jgi:hypothetical protein